MNNTEQIENIDAKIAQFQSQVKAETKSNRPVSASHTQKTVNAYIEAKDRLEKEDAEVVKNPRKKSSRKATTNSSGKRTKYTYPDGMTLDEKRKFRAKARREAAKN